MSGYLNVIERFFAGLKQFRRVATRYDKLASRFSSFVAVIASFLWLRQMLTRLSSYGIIPSTINVAEFVLF